MDAQISTFDLLPLVEQDVQLKRSGAWYIGPCPFCGGVDRFNLHQTSDGWRWFCRHCGDGKYHDAASYIMRRENVDYPAALKRMGNGEMQAKEQRVSDLRQACEDKQPPPIWRSRGDALVEECRQALWKPEGERALAYLRQRGLSDRILTQYRIGYNAAERMEPLHIWGLEGDGRVKIERGITLPCRGLGGLYSIKIRRPVQPGSMDKKYVQVRGGKAGIFGWPELRGAWLVVVVEGEIDCMTLYQEAGDLAAVCSFGSASANPMSLPLDLLRPLVMAAHTLVCYDNDEPGQSGAAAFQEHIPNSRIIHLPDLFHDINDAFTGGLDLADWLCRQVERLDIIPEMTNATPNL